MEIETVTALVHHRGAEVEPILRLLRSLGCELIESETVDELLAVVRHEPPQLVVLVPADAAEARAAFEVLPELGPRGTGVLLIATADLARAAGIDAQDRVDEVVTADAALPELVRWFEYARRLARASGMRTRASMVIRLQSG